MLKPGYETINPKALNTKDRAAKLKQKYYRTDEKCEKGHSGVRLVSNDKCFYCMVNSTYEEYWAKKKAEAKTEKWDENKTDEELSRLRNLRQLRAKVRYKKDMHNARYENSIHSLIDECLQEGTGT